MAIRVSRQEIVGEIDLMTVVKVDNAMHAILVAIGVGHHGMRRKDKAFGFQDDMIGHQSSRRQVLFEQRRRHREGFARVVETRFVRGIDRELPRRSNIDTCQIANGVIELRVAQAAGEDRPRVAGVALCLVVAQRANPGDDLGTFGRLRPLRSTFRRHLLGIEPFEHQFPLPGVVRDRLHGCVATEIERRFLLFRAMT